MLSLKYFLLGEFEKKKIDEFYGYILIAKLSLQIEFNQTKNYLKI